MELRDQLISVAPSLSNSLARTTFFWNLHFCTTKWWAGKSGGFVVASFSYTPVRRSWLSPSKPIVNINSCSGSPKLFHKSMSPHFGFLTLLDAQVRFGNTFYWILAISVSLKMHLPTGGFAPTVLEILTTGSIRVDSTRDSGLYFFFSFFGPLDGQKMILSSIHRGLYPFKT